MRNLLLAATAAIGLAATAAPASAALLNFGACVPGSLAVACAPTTTILGQPTPLLSVPSTVVGSFTVSGSAITSVGTTGATFNSQTIQISNNSGGGLIDIYFTVSDVPTLGAPLNFVSTFTSNQQNATTHSVIESTFLDNANTVFGMGTPLSSATLNNAVLETAGPDLVTTTPSGLVSLTHLYQIELLGCGAAPSVCTANLTIDLSASAPEPISIALLGTGLLGLGLVRRRG